MREFKRTGGCVRFVGLSMLGLLFLFALTPFNSAAATTTNGASDQDPTTVVRHGIDQALSVFRDKSLSLSARRTRLQTLAGQYFDFEDMARSALGYHWRDLNPQQRAQFVPIFSEFIRDAYLSRLQESSVEKIRQQSAGATIQFTKQTIDGDYAEVFSTVSVPAEKQPIKISYLLHRVDGQWRVYDITVAAISIIGNYRAQFNRVINNSGYDKLIADLKAKIRQFEQRMNRPASEAPREQ